MVDTYTANLNLRLQTTGGNSGTWGGLLNTDDFQIVDNALGGVQTVSLSAVDVTLTTTQTQNNAFILTGTLLANVALIWPAIGRTAFVINNTTGAFAVTLKAGAASATVTIQQGARRFVVINGNSVYAQTTADIGDIKEIGGSTPQPGWLLCYGQAISRSTYAALFAEIGTTYGAGDGMTTFNAPDRRGRVGAGKDNMGGVAASRLTATTMTPGGTTLGAVGGEQTHLLTVAELAAHQHLLDLELNAGALTAGAGLVKYNVASTDKTESTGGDTPHNNVQPTIIHNIVIYAGV